MKVLASRSIEAAAKAVGVPRGAPAVGLGLETPKAVLLDGTCQFCSRWFFPSVVSKSSDKAVLVPKGRASFVLELGW